MQCLLVVALALVAAEGAIIYDKNHPKCKQWEAGTLPGLYTRKTNSNGALTELDDLAAGSLCRHNAYRAAAGLNPLVWDECIADLARKHTLELDAGDKCNFYHSKGRGNKCGFSHLGENLSGSRGGTVTPERMRDGGWGTPHGWFSEVRHYQYGLKEDGSPGSYAQCPLRWGYGAIGHFTQVMWAGTTHLGCDAIICGISRVTVCMYGPTGNVGSQPAFLWDNFLQLNKSEEALGFTADGIPTCGGDPPAEVTTTKPVSGAADGKCIGLDGKECKFPYNDPEHGLITHCNFFPYKFHTANHWCFTESGAVDKCNIEDPDCPYEYE